MKRALITAAALGLTAALAACGKEEAAAPAASPTMSDEGMAGMSMPGEAKTAEGAGTVEAIDAAAGTITVDHGPIPEANWPAMTMTFKAAPEVTEAAKVGDEVAFDVRFEGGAGEITAVRKQ